MNSKFLNKRSQLIVSHLNVSKFSSNLFSLLPTKELDVQALPNITVAPV